MSEAVVFTEAEVLALRLWRDIALRAAESLRTDFSRDIARTAQERLQRALKLHLRADHGCELPAPRTLEAFHDDLHGK